MHRDQHFWLDPIASGIRGIVWVHREIPADGHHDQVGFVVFANELHVGKQAGVAHVPDFESIF